MSNRKVLLMILDGWGIGDGQKGDVIAQVHPAYISEMTRKYPHAQLRTDGENVGLPDGQMGNSEVGHLNIGAGRVVYQDLVKINRACRDDSILKNPEIVKAFEYAKSNGVSVHLMGLVSDGGVHSSLDHLLKLTDIADKYGIERTYVHCFMDGRDTDPYSGKGFIERLEKHMRERSTGVVASIVGRYYAMDRDKRWERVKVAYDLLVEGKGEHSSDMALAMQKSYDEGVTDEFVKPVVRIDEDGNPIGMIRPNDVVIFFNYRNDRAKELTIVLTQEDMPQQGMHTLPLYYCCMTPYDAKFEGLHILFDKENVADTIGEYVARQGLSQLRIAETEKYAHVTFFLNGGREEEFEGEDRILVASPKVATYDLQPEMSAYSFPISQHFHPGFPYPLGKQAVITVTGHQAETVHLPVPKNIHRIYDQCNVRRVLSGNMGGSLYKPESMLPGTFLPCGKRFPRPVSINSSHNGIPVTGNKAHYIFHPLKGCVIPVNKDCNGIS